MRQRQVDALVDRERAAVVPGVVGGDRRVHDVESSVGEIQSAAAVGCGIVVPDRAAEIQDRRAVDVSAAAAVTGSVAKQGAEADRSADGIDAAAICTGAVAFDPAVGFAGVVVDTAAVVRRFIVCERPADDPAVVVGTAAVAVTCAVVSLVVFHAAVIHRYTGGCAIVVDAAAADRRHVAFAQIGAADGRVVQVNNCISCVGAVVDAATVFGGVGRHLAVVQLYRRIFVVDTGSGISRVALVERVAGVGIADDGIADRCRVVGVVQHDPAAAVGGVVPADDDRVTGVISLDGQHAAPGEVNSGTIRVGCVRANCRRRADDAFAKYVQVAVYRTDCTTGQRL